MHIYLNSKKEEVPDNFTVEQLVQKLKLNKELIAIEINGNIIKKADYNTHKLSENDELEVLTLIGGG